jgi:ABC-2 type transport system ATP-binding protein
MSHAMSAVEVSKAYGRVTALDEVSFDVAEGAIYGLIGPNGAGKTTAIKILLNLVAPSSGSSTVVGVDSRRLGSREFEQIGYVSENLKLPDWMTLGYLLSYLKPFYRNWDDALASEMTKQFDLPVDRKLRRMSRGMQMKASLLCSLAYRPRVLILDEPFTGLDPLVRDELIGGLLERAENTAILISSHDLAEIESFSSHIGFLDKGRLRFSEEMSSLVERFREVEVTFEAPPPAPSNWPDGWMRPESSAAVLRFVATNFDEDRTAAEVRALFPAAKEIAFQPMPLRAIFLAVARQDKRASAAA